MIDCRHLIIPMTWCISNFVLTHFITFIHVLHVIFCFIPVYMFHSLLTFICTCTFPFIFTHSLGVRTRWIRTSRYGWFIYLIRFRWDRTCCEEPWVSSIRFLVFLLSYSYYYSLIPVYQTQFQSYFLYSFDIMCVRYLYIILQW